MPAALERCHGDVGWRRNVHVYSTLHFVSLLQPWSELLCIGCQQTANLERCHGNVRWRTDVNVYSTLHSLSVLQSWGIAVVTCNRDRMSMCTLSFTLYHNCSTGALATCTENMIPTCIISFTLSPYCSPRALPWQRANTER